MADLKLCPICGGELEYDVPQISLAKCKSCDAIISLTESDDYYTNIDLISFARNSKNFSESVYLTKQMLQNEEYYHNSLPSWLMFLSKYEIIYIKTPLSNKKTPSFCRYIDNMNLLEDSDFLNTINNEKNQVIKEYYYQQAKIIDALSKKMKIMSNRCNYNDIYISAKKYEINPNGEDTEKVTNDYKNAILVYDKLKKMGYNVFFVPIDAKNVIDEIEFSALLNSTILHSKLFLLFASKLSYLNSPSVKEERYKHIYFVRNKLIPPSLVYIYESEMEKIPYIPPEELHQFAHLKYNTPDFFNDLLIHIKKSVPDEIVAIQSQVVSLSTNENRIKKVIMNKTFEDDKPIPDDEKELMSLGLKYLKNKKFDDADKTFDKLKELNDKNFMVYCGKTFIKANATSLTDLTSNNKITSFDDYSYLELALKYANKTNGTALVDNLYLALKKINSPSKVDNIVWLFYLIVPYLDKSQRDSLIRSLNLTLESFVKHNALKQSAKIFGLICLLASTEKMEENKYYNKYIKSLMDKKQFSKAKEILIDLIQVYETPTTLLTLLKATLKTNSFNNFNFNYKVSKNEYGITNIIAKLITTSFYANDIKPIEQLRMLCYNQIEKFNFKSADKLITDIVSYMLPLYSVDIVSRFILKCASKFSNGGAFNLAEKYSKFAIRYSNKNCQAYFELLRTKIKAYDDYDLVNYTGAINELSEYKNMREQAKKNGNTDLLLKIDLLLKYYSKPKEFKTSKAFPRINYKKVKFNKVAKILGGILIISIIASICIVLNSI